jgi:hypothetical protein
VVVCYEAPSGEPIRAKCKTVSVGVNGALLALGGALNVEQVVQLTNAKTGEEVQCVVKSVRQLEKENVYHVAMEFLVWAPKFWEITFPRQEGDPPPGPQQRNTRTEKPFFGRVGPMPPNLGDEAPPDAFPTNPAKQQSSIRTLAERLWRRRKPSK